jgi:hypothetical protein
VETLRAYAESSGIRIECPLLDAEVVDLAVALPQEVFASFGVERGVFREGFADLLPSSALRGRGAGPPIEPGVAHAAGPFLHAWRHDILERGRLTTGGFLPLAALEESASRAQHGDWTGTRLMLSFVALEVWCAEREVAT